MQSLYVLNIGCGLLTLSLYATCYYRGGKKKVRGVYYVYKKSIKKSEGAGCRLWKIWSLPGCGIE